MSSYRRQISSSMTNTPYQESGLEGMMPSTLIIWPLPCLPFKVCCDNLSVMDHLCFRAYIDPMLEANNGQ